MLRVANHTEMGGYVGRLRSALSKSVQRSSTASIPTLSRINDEGRCSCPGLNWTLFAGEKNANGFKRRDQERCCGWSVRRTQVSFYSLTRSDTAEDITRGRFPGQLILAKRSEAGLP
jgi:hypothetical protein